MNNPPRTRADLVKAAEHFLDDRLTNPTTTHPAHYASYELLGCWEDWLGIDLVRLMEIFCREPIAREKFIQEMAKEVTAKLSKGYAAAAEAAVKYFEEKTGRVWQELFPMFNPEPRVVYKGLLHEKEREIL